MDVDNDKLKEVLEVNTQLMTRKVANEFNVNDSTMVLHLRKIWKVVK